MIERLLWFAIGAFMGYQIGRSVLVIECGDTGPAEIERPAEPEVWL